MTTGAEAGPPAGSSEGVAHAFAAAWNAHDADAIAALMAPDARFVTAFGLVLRGREAIRAAHEGAFRRAYRAASVTTLSVQTLRQGPDHALVALDWRISGTTEAAGERGAFLFALETGGTDGAGGWRIAAAQNTARAVGRA